MKIQNTLSKTQRQDLILYPNRLKMLFWLARSLIFLAIGIWLVSSGEAVLTCIGIVSTGSFGLRGSLYLFNMASPLPVLIVNKEGLRQQTPLGSVFVAWGEISTIRLFKKGSAYSGYLNIYLSQIGKETFFARRSRIWHIYRLFGNLPVITFAPFLSPIPTQQMLAAIQKGYQQQIKEYNIIIH